MSGVLLDTCAIIWVQADEPMNPEGRAAIAAAADAYELFVSPVSAWELGMLTSPRRKTPLQLGLPAEAFFIAMLGKAGVSLLPLDPRTAVAASFLPEPLHGDPADRMLIAAAREHGLTLATSDQRILDYAALGHVRAVRC